MIIVRLSDGLGNQMFQYALGRRLALDNDDTLKLDLAWYEQRDVFGGTERTVTLDGFDVLFDPATPEDVASVIGGKRLSLLLRRYGHLLEYAPRLPARYFNYYRQIRERAPNPEEPPSWPHRRRFCPDVLAIDGDAYLDGYWQVPAYFEDIRDVLLEDFTVSNPLQGANAETAARIDETTAVSVHVRRGDQTGRGPDWDEFGNALRPPYYDRASALIADRVDATDLHLFVFSDDPDWCRTGLDLDYPTTVVDNNDGSTDYEDVRLMRRCDHHIIANSTFSWWGAWLCEHEDKIVTAPSPWHKYGRPEGIIHEWEFLPEDWIVVEY
ncbi:MAG: alpha-1,2-fucosyltransferase [Haloferacaceae archaeon]